ncbi:MAG: hypothetical protein V1886_03535 [archaeon]
MPFEKYKPLLFIENPKLKRVEGFLDTPEKVQQLRSDLEKSSEEAFKRIDREKRDCLAHARDYILDGYPN